MYHEKCACGAEIEIDRANGPKRTEELIENWRRNHRHQDPVPTGLRIQRKDENSPWEVADDDGAI